MQIIYLFFVYFNVKSKRNIVCFTKVKMYEIITENYKTLELCVGTITTHGCPRFFLRGVK